MGIFQAPVLDKEKVSTWEGEVNYGPAEFDPPESIGGYARSMSKLRTILVVVVLLSLFRPFGSSSID